MTKAKVKMDDVAREANVGRSTVSHVINNTDKKIRISAATRKRVMQAVDKLGYRVHMGARSIAGKGLRCIGVLGFEDSRGNTAAGIRVSGINREAIDNDYFMAYAGLEKESLEDETYVPKLIREHLVDGLIVLQSDALPDHLHRKIERYDIPAVWMQYQRAVNSVWLDETPFGLDGTRYLIGLGHRRITFMDFSFTGDFWSVARLTGYEQAMGEAGLETAKICQHTNRHNRQPIIKSILSRQDKPTAILCNSISTVLPLMMIAKRMGLRVPEDLSVITIADTQQASLSAPKLTFWDNRDVEHGQLAAQMLFERIRNPGIDIPSQSLKLENAVYGGSTGPCREDV